PPLRLAIVGSGGLTRRLEVWRAPRMIADRGTEAAADLLNPAIAPSVVVCGQRVDPQRHAGDLLHVAEGYQRRADEANGATQDRACDRCAGILPPCLTSG